MRRKHGRSWWSLATLCGVMALWTTLPSRAQGTGTESAAPAGAAREAAVQGSVADPSGAVIPGAAVQLLTTEDTPLARDVTDMEGHFTVRAPLPGTYRLAVTAAGFGSYLSPPFDLHAGEDRPWPSITLALPTNHADATVTLNRTEIADAEVHAAEHQRILGFPDFYTSFVWNAAPLNTRQKFSLGLHATLDPMAFLTAGLVAGAEQINNTFPEFGDGFGGFGKRYGAAYTDAFTGKLIGSALFPALFHQDPRYFYMGPNATRKQRIRHAVLSAVLTRGDNGHTEINFSHILGNASAGALSTVYHPASDSPQKLALDNALLGTLGEAGVNVVRELFLKRFVRGGNAYDNGMPRAAAPPSPAQNPIPSRTIQ